MASEAASTLGSASWLGWVLLALVAAVAGWVFLRQQRDRASLQASLDAANSRLDEAVGQDALTGLPKREALEGRLDAAVLKADRDGCAVCLLYLGMDDFRTVNDSWGHATGDAVLAEIASRISATAPPDSAVARIGGDEFAVMLVCEIDAARLFATALLAELARPFPAPAGQTLHVACSIGIASYPDLASRPRLIRNAATAMRAAKLAGGASHMDYDVRMGVDQRERNELANDLRMAIDQRQLELFYQPKVDARTLQITAAEALLRWHHPVRGIVSPAVFIPIAEAHGMIGPIGNWVVEEATRQAAVWRANGLRMRVAINVSGYQMRQDDFVQRLDALLRQHGLPAARFTCEITETVAMEDTRATQLAFERLRQVGVHVSIDDFGTGHSSLATLRSLPAAELKIDRAFVSDLGESPDALAIATAIVQLAHSLELRVVAEGVETATQRDHLVALGCDELQGYLFAKPMTAAALQLWAMNDEREHGPNFSPSLFQDTVPSDGA